MTMTSEKRLVEILEKINRKIPLLTELQLERLTGFGEGLLLMTDAQVPAPRMQQPVAAQAGA